MPNEISGAVTKCEKREKPFFISLCKIADVPFIDFADVLKNTKEVTFLPVDAHLNKQGAIVTANKISAIIDQNSAFTSEMTYPQSSIPALLGDEIPSQDKLVEDKKGLPYKLHTNAQGLRMNNFVEFPKRKQHILFMGDSEIYFAGMDNSETLGGVLQSKYPDKTIVNTSKWAYSIDDEFSLWNQKTKYIQPDLVFLQVSGLNVPGLYFSNRLKFHRSYLGWILTPSPLELQYYKSNFN